MKRQKDKNRAKRTHPRTRITSVTPWPADALAKAYKRTSDQRWEGIETAATAAQGRLAWDD